MAGRYCIFIGADVRHDDKIIAAIGRIRKTVHTDVMEANRVPHADVWIVYDRSIIGTLNAQQDILACFQFLKVNCSLHNLHVVQQEIIGLRYINKRIAVFVRIVTSKGIALRGKSSLCAENPSSSSREV